MNHQPNHSRQRMLVLVGPTAVGKTKLSLELARHYGCEIISGDSMQVYRGMDIGTAKISPEEQRGIKHHLIDILNPDEPFSVSDFQDKCRHAARAIHDRGQLPFIVGGTGLYVESACYDFQFTEVAGDEAFRQRMSAWAEAEGPDPLHHKLREVDPITAERLHPNDVRRVIRALEIYEVSGVPLSFHLEHQKKEPLYDLCMIALTMDRALLYERINLRVDLMLQDGLIEEVERLLAQGYRRELVSMQGLGYKEIAAYLHGEISLQQAVEDLKQGTRRYAKRQLSWFRHMKDIHWVDVTEHEKNSEHLQTIHDIIAGKFRMDGECSKMPIDSEQPNEL